MTEVQFAGAGDLEFLEANCKVPAPVIRRKVEWREIVVAKRGEFPVGYAVLEHLWARAPFIAFLWVQEDNRRSGIGRALIRFLEEFYRQRGDKFLFSSSQLNEPSPQQWHRHVGFEECGIIAGINAEGVGEVFFRKRLNAA